MGPLNLREPERDLAHSCLCVHKVGVSLEWEFVQGAVSEAGDGRLEPAVENLDSCVCVCWSSVESLQCDTSLFSPCCLSRQKKVCFLSYTGLTPFASALVTSGVRNAGEEGALF